MPTEIINDKTKKMIIVQVKDGESIDKALKKYKKKYEKTMVVKQLRERQKFTKDSVKRRKELIKATYVEQLKRNIESI